MNQQKKSLTKIEVLIIFLFIFAALCIHKNYEKYHDLNSEFTKKKENEIIDKSDLKSNQFQIKKVKNKIAQVNEIQNKKENQLLEFQLSILKLEEKMPWLKNKKKKSLKKEEKNIQTNYSLQKEKYGELKLELNFLDSILQQLHTKQHVLDSTTSIINNNYSLQYSYYLKALNSKKKKTILIDSALANGILFIAFFLFLYFSGISNAFECRLFIVMGIILCLLFISYGYDFKGFLGVSISLLITFLFILLVLKKL